MSPWLRFFRVVNLPTVPGDVLVGVAAMASGGTAFGWRGIVGAVLAGILVYLFGLADNDIVGAATDADRPIVAGEISVRSARSARALCLFGALIVGAAFELPAGWWPAAFALTGVIVLYNRTKFSLAMGLCRGLNVLCGGMLAIPGGTPRGLVVLIALVGLWTIYITLVTVYSEGEERDPGRKHRVGLLVGAIVYLQLLALVVLYLLSPALLTRTLLVAGAAMLVALRLARRAFSWVSAS